MKYLSPTYYVSSAHIGVSSQVSKALFFLFLFNYSRQHENPRCWFVFLLLVFFHFRGTVEFRDNYQFNIFVCAQYLSNNVNNQLSVV